MEVGVSVNSEMLLQEAKPIISLEWKGILQLGVCMITECNLSSFALLINLYQFIVDRDDPQDRYCSA
jgi:hypothetical protein